MEPATPEPRIPPLKKAAAQLARLLPPSWRLPICGVSASTCGLEATQPVPASTASRNDSFLPPLEKFFSQSPDDLLRDHLVSVPKGIAWARGAHLTTDGRLITPLSVGMNLPMDRWLVKRQRFFPRIRRQPGPVVSLATDGHNNFYHWMLDLLPKLFLVLAAGLGHSRFYIGASHPFQKQSLNLLGIAPEQILDANEIPFLQADQLIVPHLGDAHPPNIFDAAKCRLLVSVFAQLIPPGETQLPRRFVISRQKTRSRRVVNEPELLARLAPLGFAPVYPEDLTLRDQIALFAGAEAIVASTGAGLINLIHCPPGIPVAILMPEHCPDLVCLDLARFARLRGEIFFAEPHPPGTMDRIGCDMKLDESLLARLIAFFT